MLASKQDFLDITQGKCVLFSQHQFAALKDKGHLVTYGIQDCIVLFLYGKDRTGRNVGLGAHIGRKQSEAVIDKLIQEIKESKAFDEKQIDKYELVGGYYGITPLPFRSSIIANRIKSSMEKHFGLASPAHEHYNKIGNLGPTSFYLRPAGIIMAGLLLLKEREGLFKNPAMLILALLFCGLFIKALERGYSKILDYQVAFSAALDVATGKISALENDMTFLSRLDPSGQFSDTSNNLLIEQAAAFDKQRLGISELRRKESESLKEYEERINCSREKRSHAYTFYNPQEVLDHIRLPKGFIHYYKNNVLKNIDTNNTPGFS